MRMGKRTFFHDESAAIMFAVFTASQTDQMTLRQNAERALQDRNVWWENEV